MGIFDRIRSTQKPVAAKPKEDKKKEVSSASSSVSVPPRQVKNGERFLIAPRVSEKAAALAARGVYVFNVPLSANKVEICKAVETLWSVKVESVRTVRGMGKRMIRGRVRGQRNDWKKALVKLQKGQTIDVYAGV